MSTDNVQTDPTLRTCSCCHVPKPIDAFTRRHKGNNDVRLPCCKTCRNGRTRRLRAAKRAKRLDEIAVKIRDERDEAAVIALYADLIRRFGGVYEFAKTWFDCFQAATPGSKRAANMLLAIERMFEALRPIIAKPIDLDMISDEELNELGRKQAKAFLESVA